VTDPPVPVWLAQAPMHVEGALTEASNLTLRVQFEGADGSLGAHRGVYKPVRGERPLRDFPSGTLAQREVTAYLVSAWGGWDNVPATILRDGPLGPGSVQVWVEASEHDDPHTGDLVRIMEPQEVSSGWLPVVQAEGRAGEPLVVAHADDPDLAALAVLDVVLNNADRKAAHIARDEHRAVWGFDHGLCGHQTPKLRTVLWGWAGEPLPARETARLRLLLERLDVARLSELLSDLEVSTLVARAEALLEDGIFPLPPYERYPLPWPLW
jgi:uncharacterized repeat protein (TIGR03843 family)